MKRDCALGTFRTISALHGWADRVQIAFVGEDWRWPNGFSCKASPGE